MSPFFLSLFVDYGAFALFAILLVASVGVPFPSSLLLLAAGAFAAQGEVDPIGALVLSVAGAVIGDQIGYGIGRWGGRPLVERIGDRFGARDQVDRGEAFARKYAGASVFVTRWLLGGLAPWINLITGASAYPWPRFLLWDFTGKLLWVLIYGGLGYAFSDRVAETSRLLGNLTWAIAGLALTAFLGYRVYRQWRASSVAQPQSFS